MATKFKTKDENDKEDQQRKLKLKEFVEEQALDKVRSNLSKGKKYIMINFSNLMKFDPDLADYFLDHPDEIKATFNVILDQFDLNKEKDIDLDILIDNLPKTQWLRVNGIRVKDLYKLVYLNVVVTGRSNVYARLTHITAECPHCSERRTIKQTKETIKNATNCGCGFKKSEGFNIIDKRFKNTIRLYVEDLPENLKGSEQPNDIVVQLYETLCDKDHKLTVGTRIQLVGYIEDMPTKATRGSPTVNCDYSFHALNYKNLDFIDMNTSVSKEEQELFDEIKSKNNPAKFISRLLYPDIYGHTMAKESAIYQQFGGTMIQTAESEKRDFINILFIGDPSTAKSDISLRAIRMNPIHLEASGPDISGVGFTAALTEDKRRGGYNCTAGLLPRGHKGVLHVDEIDKTNPDYLKHLHKPLEHGSYEVNKARSSRGVCHTALLATANPKVVGKSSKVVENIPFMASLLDRMDMVIPFDDVIDLEKDQKIAEKITTRSNISTTSSNNLTTQSDNSTTPSRNNTTFYYNGTTFHISTLTKYILQCKKYIPEVSRRGTLWVTNWYVQVRQASNDENYEGKLPRSRAIESILRMARAIARSKQTNTISKSILELAVKYIGSGYPVPINFTVKYEEIKDETEQQPETIHHKCSVCGTTPTNYWTDDGKAICKQCKDKPKEEKVSQTLPKEESNSSSTKTIPYNTIRMAVKNRGGFPVKEFIMNFGQENYNKYVNLLEEFKEIDGKLYLNLTKY